MRWTNWKPLIAAAAALCCALAISGSSFRPQFPVQPTPPLDQSNQKPPFPSASPSPSPAAETQRRPEFFVMIDPGHGGYDTGADFGGKLLEKDITLKLARELRKELEDRGIASRLLRDSDVDLALDRRAEITNEQRASLYIALHAGRPGRGVRVYAPFLADVQPPAGRFLPWESGQAPALDRSKSAAQAIAAELRRKDLAVSVLGVPIRPLNSIIAPAVAVELAPEGPDLQSLDNPKRNTGVAAAIASAVAQLRGQTRVPDARAPGLRRFCAIWDGDARALCAWRGGGARP
jgi:N-acetylmuramoyl-L-alanine amidase